MRKGHNAALMRVCHLLHASAVPFVWDYISTLSILLELIPGLEALPHIPGSSHLENIRLPDTLDLARFNVYAPHVRSLLLSSDLISKCENWDSFYTIARSTTLLPNLSRILLGTSRVLGQQLVTCATVFLSPSVNEVWNIEQRWFKQLGEYDSLALEQVLKLLQNIASACPGIKSLDIHPSLLPDKQRSNPRHGYFTEFRYSVQSFTCLRELSINTLALEQHTFLALGELPTLETMSIYPCVYDEIVGSLALPDNAFPALRCLNLKMMSSGSMVELCGLKPLVWRLATLGILPQPGSDYPELPRLCLAKPLSVLAKNNSTLSSLLVEEHVMSSAIAFEIDLALLQQFQHFPLRQVNLPIHTLSSELTLENLVEVLHVVEELYLEQDAYGAIELEQLRAFASLPNLRNLEINVDFESVWDLDEVDFETPQNQSLAYTELRCCFEQVGENKSLAKPVAEFLHTLWPNVTCSPELRLGSIDPMMSDEGIHFINAELLVLRQKATLG
ncbi:hypothetical protein BDV93DRAFT_541451 [Ceratobasidium sp. AG-I]|nr:hypothetical protein BDV93DRAFT_541451 [Ceratobasidium sp. AG-I]